MMPLQDYHTSSLLEHQVVWQIVTYLTSVEEETQKVNVEEQKYSLPILPMAILLVFLGLGLSNVWVAPLMYSELNWKC